MAPTLTRTTKNAKAFSYLLVLVMTNQDFCPLLGVLASFDGTRLPRGNELFERQLSRGAVAQLHPVAAGTAISHPMLGICCWTMVRTFRINYKRFGNVLRLDSRTTRTAILVLATLSFPKTKV